MSKSDGHDGRDKSGHHERVVQHVFANSCSRSVEVNGRYHGGVVWDKEIPVDGRDHGR